MQQPKGFSLKLFFGHIEDFSNFSVVGALEKDTTHIPKKKGAGNGRKLIYYGN